MAAQMKPEPTPGTAVAFHQPAGTPAAMKAALSAMAPSLAQVLPRHVTPERVVALTLLAANKQPDLLKCTPASVAAALMRISQWGLEIGTTAHLLTFNSKDKDGNWKTECQAVADYKGLIQLVLETGHVRDLYAEAVHAADHFRVVKGSEARIEHEPAWNVPDRGDIIGVYAVAILRGQRTTFEVMNVAQVEAIRGRSKAKDRGPWVTDFAEMAKKTVVRRLCKRLPQQSTKLRAVLNAEDEVPGAFEIVGGEPRGLVSATLPTGPRALITTGGDGYEQPTLVEEPQRAARPTGYRPPPGGRVVDALEQSRGLDMARRVASDPDPYGHGEPGEMTDEAALALDERRQEADDMAAELPLADARPAKRGRDALREGL